MNELQKITVIETKRKKNVIENMEPGKIDEVQQPEILIAGLIDKIIHVLGKAPGK
tara:strand:- start:240 stop:404 length:165 start_codon:yes stop_codon:yes gene_type:complete